MIDITFRYLVLVAVIMVCITLGVWHLCVVLLDRATSFIGEHAGDFE